MGRDTVVYVASGGSAKQSARQTQQSNVKHIIDKKKKKKWQQRLITAIIIDIAAGYKLNSDTQPKLMPLIKSIKLSTIPNERQKKVTETKLFSLVIDKYLWHT